MYTLVLMTAVAAGPDASQFNRWGGCYSACYGTSCVGCQGYAPLFPRVRALFSCGGCYSSCHGCYAACNGCYSTCHGCYSTCHGCYSCHGCCGGIYIGASVYGGCYGASCVGCQGCVGCVGCQGGVFYPGPIELMPKVPAVSSAVLEAPATQVAYKPAADPTAAALTVSLPAAARLYVDGQLVAGDGPTRRFHTPPLAAEKSFYYELKAELLVGGKVEVEETRVVIRAGDSRDVSFAKLAAAASAGTAVAARQ